MPTVALYVPADVFRRLGEDAALVREVAGAALVVAAGLGAGEPRADLSSVPASRAPVGSVAGPSPAPSPRLLPTSVKEFKGPDPKGGKK